jgi:phosphate starvation-inducible PhoH-like protein
LRESLVLGDAETERSLLGPGDANLRRLREELGVTASVRQGCLTVDGPGASVERALGVARQLLSLVESGVRPRPEDVERLARAATAPVPGGPEAVAVVPGRGVRVFGSSRYVRPRSPGQAAYLEALARADIVLCSGPAGTGKTYLAVAQACADLAAGKVGRIVLTRPAVEAGERLGFLPGDFREKVHPYLRPLYDALDDMLPERDLSRHVATGTIEVVPLAYMRGRTLSGAFAILDEAQNTTAMQMLMFLTRLGWDSRAAVVGDATQLDLPSGEVSGLSHAMGLLRGIEGLEVMELGEQDVVRHRLVRHIVSAYGNGRIGGGRGNPAGT